MIQFLHDLWNWRGNARKAREALNQRLQHARAMVAANNAKLEALTTRIPLEYEDRASKSTRLKQMG